MLRIGIVLVVIAVVLILIGLFSAAVKVLLWVGIALLVVGAVLWLIDSTRGRSRL